MSDRNFVVVAVSGEQQVYVATGDQRVSRKDGQRIATHEVQSGAARVAWVSQVVAEVKAPS